VTLYVLLGLIGLPFFAEGKGGSAVILGQSGGYIIGFVVAGTIVGRLAELGWDRRISGAVAMMLVGTIVIYAIGLPWLSYVRHLSVADTISGGLAPFIVWDTVKLLVAAGIFPVAWWLIGRRPDDR
jgi:biotin transport system substrate-specific component